MQSAKSSKSHRGRKYVKQFNTSFNNFQDFLQKSQQKPVKTMFMQKNSATGDIRIQKLNFGSTTSSGQFLPPKSVDKFSRSSTTRNGFSFQKQQLLMSQTQTPLSKPQLMSFQNALQQREPLPKQIKAKIESNAMQRFQELFRKETSLRAKRIEDEQSKRLMKLLESTSRKTNQQNKAPSSHHREQKHQNKFFGNPINSTIGSRKRIKIQQNSHDTPVNKNLTESAQNNPRKQAVQRINDAKNLGVKENIKCSKLSLIGSNKSTIIQKQSGQYYEEEEQNKFRKKESFFSRDSRKSIELAKEIKKKKIPINGGSNFNLETNNPHPSYNDLKKANNQEISRDEPILKNEKQVQNAQSSPNNENKQSHNLLKYDQQSREQFNDSSSQEENQQQSFSQEQQQQPSCQKIQAEGNQKRYNNNQQLFSGSQNNESSLAKENKCLAKEKLPEQLSFKENNQTVKQSSRGQIALKKQEQTHLNNENSQKKQEKKQLKLQQQPKLQQPSSISYNAIKQLQKQKQPSINTSVEYHKKNSFKTSDMDFEMLPSAQVINKIPSLSNKATNDPHPTIKPSTPKNNTITTKPAITIKTSKQIKPQVNGFSTSTNNNNMSDKKINSHNFKEREIDEIDELEEVSIGNGKSQKQSQKVNGVSGGSSGERKEVDGHGKGPSKTSIANRLIEKQPPSQQPIPTTNHSTTSKPSITPIQSFNKQPQPSSPHSSASQHSISPADQLDYLLDLLQTLGSYHTNSKHFYSQPDSSMVQIVMNHKLASYFIAHQYHFYINMFLKAIQQAKNSMSGMSTKGSKFYMLRPEDILEALEDEELVESLEQLQKSSQLSIKLIKMTYEKCKPFLKKDEKQLLIESTKNYYQKCLLYLKNEFQGLYKIYLEKTTSAIGKRLCYLVETFCLVMALDGKEVKEYEDVEEMETGGYVRHVNRYKGVVLMDNS